MSTLVALLAYSLTSASQLEASSIVATVAGVLAAILAAYAAWDVTDRLLAWRSRPQSEED